MEILPPQVQVHISDSTYERRMMGQGEMYAERKRRKVQCSECMKILAQASLYNHLIRQHGTHLRVLELLNNIPDKGPPMIYQVSSTVESNYVLQRTVLVRQRHVLI
jgi:hypothetical protein